MLTYIDFGAGDVPWLKVTSNPSNTQTIHLSAANGFSVASYAHLISEIGPQFNFTGMDCRGAWPQQKPPSKGFNMHDFADDLIQGLESQHQQKVIGMGHSQGGLVSLLAAIKRPDLFSKLVLIDPASLPNRWIDPIYSKVPQTLLFKLFPFMQGSLNRQKVWPSKQAFYDRYRAHSTYKRFTEKAFNDYIESGLQANNKQQFELTFSPEWEAHIFRTVEFIWKYLDKIQIPTLFIRTQYSNLYSHKQFINYNRGLASHIETIELPKTYHLAPHEAPQEVAASIKDWL